MLSQGRDDLGLVSVFENAQHSDGTEQSQGRDIHVESYGLHVACHRTKTKLLQNALSSNRFGSNADDEAQHSNTAVEELRTGELLLVDLLGSHVLELRFRVNHCK
eukprot:g8505.t1